MGTWKGFFAKTSPRVSLTTSSVPGALVGGMALGLIESFAGYFFGPQHAITLGFVVMLVLLLVRPTGLVGVKGYE